MKRIAAFIAAILISLPVACADIPNFSAMTNSEIMDIINAGRNALYTSNPVKGELARRKTDDGVTIIITDVKAGAGDPRYAFINWSVINNSNSNYRITVNAIYVNGWKVYERVFYTIEAHRRSKESFDFFLGDADLTNIKGIEDIEIQLSVRTDNNDEIHLDTIYIKW